MFCVNTDLWFNTASFIDYFMISSLALATLNARYGLVLCFICSSSCL